MQREAPRSIVEQHQQQLRVIGCSYKRRGRHRVKFNFNIVIELPPSHVSGFTGTVSLNCATSVQAEALVDDIRQGLALRRLPGRGRAGARS